MTRRTSIVIAAVLAVAVVAATVGLAVLIAGDHHDGKTRSDQGMMAPAQRDMPGAGTERGPHGGPRGPGSLGLRDGGDGGASVVATVSLAVSLAAALTGLVMLLATQRPWRKGPTAQVAGAAGGPGDGVAPPPEAKTESLQTPADQAADTGPLTTGTTDEAAPAVNGEENAVPGDGPVTLSEDQGDKSGAD
jgi:hypothetical protein